MAAESEAKARTVAELAYASENYAMRLVLSAVLKLAGERLQSAVQARTDGATILERVWSQSDTQMQ